MKLQLYTLIFLVSYISAMEIQKDQESRSYRYYIDANHHPDCEMEYTPLCIIKGYIQHTNRGWRLFPVAPEGFVKKYNELPAGDFLECTPLMYDWYFENEELTAREITFDEYMQLCASHLEIEANNINTQPRTTACS
jgi:pterin-4a-carbinolamine dehydratase